MLKILTRAPKMLGMASSNASRCAYCTMEYIDTGYGQFDCGFYLIANQCNIYASTSTK